MGAIPPSSSSSSSSVTKRKVAYFYDSDIGYNYYAQNHAMLPHRIQMANNLIGHYDLYKSMDIYKPFPASPDDIKVFHSEDYVDFLSSVSPKSIQDHEMARFKIDGDCPIFDGLFQFCQASAGGSIGAAVLLNLKKAEIAINWAGGLHHAKKCTASGFCYVNDIVLGILELLKVHQRVLYVDIDVHHGDGVEEAFFSTNRVMTVSFHKYDGKYFPGSGHLKDVGSESGVNYSLNIPLKDGIDDASFSGLFRSIIEKVMERYSPEVVVLQCGADSLSGDRLGCFNLTVKGHAECLQVLRSFNVPLMVLGGGGYTIHNVARCWCYETAVAVGEELANELPLNEYYEYYGPDHTLHIPPSRMKNQNSPGDLERIRNILFDRISELEAVPSVPFHETPPNVQVPEL